MNDLPDESPSQALARIEQQRTTDLNPRAQIEVDGPGGTTKLALSDEQFDALMRQDLVIGFYNLSNRLPEPYDFDGLADKTDDECRSMYGRTRSVYLRGHLLMEDNSKPLDISKHWPLRRCTDARIGVLARRRSTRIYSSRNPDSSRTLRLDPRRMAFLWVGSSTRRSRRSPATDSSLACASNK